jgi:hypothetical protein
MPPPTRPRPDLELVVLVEVVAVVLVLLLLLLEAEVQIQIEVGPDVDGGMEIQVEVKNKVVLGVVEVLVRVVVVGLVGVVVVVVLVLVLEVVLELRAVVVLLVVLLVVVPTSDALQQQKQPCLLGRSRTFVGSLHRFEQHYQFGYAAESGFRAETGTHDVLQLLEQSCFRSAPTASGSQAPFSASVSLFFPPAGGATQLTGVPFFFADTRCAGRRRRT